MKFGPLPIDQALGAVLGHNVYGDDGRRRLRKGRRLTPPDIELLAQVGRSSVFAATLEPGDVLEDEAALRVSQAAADPTDLVLSGPATGRVNFRAEKLGILRVDVERLLELNEINGITLATLESNRAVHAGRTVATTKILPYALSETAVAGAEALLVEAPVLRLEALPERRVGLLVTASSGSLDATLKGFDAPLRRRVEALGSSITEARAVELTGDGEVEHLEAALGELSRRPIDLLLLAGETAIQDRLDLAPRALEAAGGEVAVFGAPVDPGNLLLLGQLGGIAVLGAPGCARSPKTNIVDLLLPRLLAGDLLTRRDVLELAHGGLLEDVPERPLPRSRV